MKALCFSVVVVFVVKCSIEEVTAPSYQASLPLLPASTVSGAGSKQSSKEHSGFQGKHISTVETRQTCLEQEGFCSKGYLGPKLVSFIWYVLCVLVPTEYLITEMIGLNSDDWPAPRLNSVDRGEKEQLHQTPGACHSQPWAAVGWTIRHLE